eukprot:gnl/MRDRNA2_/MRDRNA2_70285_c0_seq1.p2 gnl/MRDRNA2_/MRDRNA2_70285_c0~~gnl/MRDRNA2_/MRDRNA2_70285_c0_seq1.p2  ORF type:complete len:123 (+),score=20.12 gnl/MRDRNA2_/MRDRNA2_70285_c0_seq1:371-739(+)
MEVIGYLHAHIDEKHVDVAHLMVSERHRGRGLGALLLMGLICHVERDCKQASRAIRELRLSVLKENRPAVRLYRRLGFKTDCREGQQLSQDEVYWIRMKWDNSDNLQTKEVFRKHCVNRLKP